MADSREYRSQFVVTSFAFLGILFAILIAVYWLGPSLGFKFDLTEDKVFTISKETKGILGELQDIVTVRYWCSEHPPSGLVNLKRDTIDTFRELEGLSNGLLKYEVVAPEEEARKFAQDKVKEYFDAKAKNETPKEPTEKESFEDLFMNRGRAKKTDAEIAEDRRKKAEFLATRSKGAGATVDELYRQLLTEEFKSTYLSDLQKKGIFPVPVEERQASSTTETNFYTAIEIKYQERTPEVIPMHHQMQSLEYEMASKILKLTRSSKPKVLFFDGRKPEMPPPNPMNPMQPPPTDYAGIIQALGELFDIDEISLKEGNSISDVQKRIEEDLKKTDDDRAKEDKPHKVSCLVVAQPHELEDRQVYEISKAVSEGIPTIFLVSNYSVDVSRNGMQGGFPVSSLRPRLDDLFRTWGITLGKDMVASKDCGPVVVPQRYPGLPFAVPAPYPMPFIARAAGDEINQRHGLTMKLPSLLFPAAVGVTLSDEDMKKAGIENSIVLASSGKQSYTVNVPMFTQNMFGKAEPAKVLGNKDLSEKRAPRDSFIESKPLAVLLEGKFPFKYEGVIVPDWKPQEKRPGAGGPPGFPGMPGMPGMPGGLPPGHPGAGGAFNFPEPEPEMEEEAEGPGGPKGPRGPEETLLAQAPAPAQPAPVPAPAPAAPQAKDEKKDAPKSDAALPIAPAAAPATTPPPAPAAAGAAAPVPPAPVPPAPVPPTPGAVPAEAGKKDEPKKEPEKGHVEQQKSRVLVLSSADMMKTDYLALSQQVSEYQSNINFFYNAIETFGLDDRLLHIRRKDVTERRFKSGSGEGSAPQWIQIVNIAALPVAVGVFGLFRFFLRRAEANRYERQYIQDVPSPMLGTTSSPPGSSKHEG